MVCHDTGRPARTGWKALRRVGQGDAAETRMRLMPVTGRSHQLRVHMRELGHPILGDSLYATGAAAAHPRLMLHAESLRLRHPDGGEGMTFRAACPF
jgi:tRNA pseudouridine32 synthase/23S rRNA pseudouridine746 synthase